VAKNHFFSTQEGADRKYLRAAELTIVDFHRCQSDYDFITLTDRVMCAREPQEEKGPCTGDVGGALVLTEFEKQRGIFSWSNGCVYAHYPSVFTDLTHPEIHDFIDSELQQVAVESSSKESEA